MQQREPDTSESRRPAGNLVDVLERTIGRVYARRGEPFALEVTGTTGFVVRQGYELLEAAEFHRVDKQGPWSFYQVLIRPLDNPQRIAGEERLPDVPLEIVGPEVLGKYEDRQARTSKWRFRHRDHLDRLLDAWLQPRTQKGMAEYAALAWAYADEVRKGNSKATATLAARIGASPAVTAQRVKEARRRGLLSAGAQGRASGSITKLGMHYASPGSRSLAEMRIEGVSVAKIARALDLTEAEVGAALAAEGFPELAVDLASSETLGRTEQEGV